MPRISEEKRRAKEREEDLRWQYYRSIPQKHIREMTGKQTNQLKEQAELYDIPFGGAVVDLTAVFPALFAFLAKNSRKIAYASEDMMDGPESPALERFREERAAMVKIQRQELEKTLLRREDCREVFGVVAAILRQVGDRLQKEHGPAAADILIEALEDCQEKIEAAFDEPDS